MGEQIKIYPHNWTLISKKTEWTVNKYNYMDTTQNHYAEGKKPDTEEYMLHDHIYMKF